MSVYVDDMRAQFGSLVMWTRDNLMLKRMKNRYAEMKLMHVGLGSDFWHPLDVLYVLTGKVWD